MSAEPGPTTLAAILRDARRRLAEGEVPGADFDARLLVADALGLDAAGLLLRGAEPVSTAHRRVIEARLARRLAGEPVHRILGHRAFWTHEFALSPDTLEPRPDTEVLVELCRRPMEARIAAKGACVFADLGTGTGAIAVSLLGLFPRATGIAVDLSPGALATAVGNAGRAGVGARFWPLVSDYGAALAGPLDLLVSNPPYIPSAEIAGLDREVRIFDPRLALDGGVDGLDAYRAIAADAARLLAPGGDVLVEIGQGQASDVEACFRRAGLVPAASARDLGDVERALHFRRGD